MSNRVAASLLGAVLALAAVGCAGGPRPTLQPAPSAPPSTAPPQLADVQAAIRRGLASLESFRADVILARARIPGEVRATVERTAAGLFKEVQSTPDVESVFFSDARAGRKVSYTAPPPGKGGPSARQETNIDVGSPSRPISHGVPLDPVDLAREVLGWEEARVNRDEVAGRAVWVVQGSTPNTLPELRVVTIDDETGLALRFDALQGGQPEYQVQVENLVTNLDAEPSYALPGGTTLYRGDMGHVRMTLEQAGRAAGLVPLVPEWLPPGFMQAEVASTTSEGRGPKRISAAFRRGMDVMVLHVTPGPVAPRAPGITIARGERDPEGNLSVPRREERRRLSAGVLAGVDAELSSGRTSGLSAADEARLVHLSGDVTIEDLMRVAESLQPAR